MYSMNIRLPQVCSLIVILLFIPLFSHAEISFRNIAIEPDKGLKYARNPTPELLANREYLFNIGEVPIQDGNTQFPYKWAGSPGVAIFDFDADGDLDIYVTNGPDNANSLFKNLLIESGTMSFQDVTESAGIAAIAQDSTGVCFGDIDNDGDHDLLVLGRDGAHRLYENQGNGYFEDISSKAGVSGRYKGSSSCSMGDINNDGLLDIAVANTFDWITHEAIVYEPFMLNQHNALYLNVGKNRFVDISESSGIQLINFPLTTDVPPGAAGISWSIAFVDYDQDGDVDLVITDDQGEIPHAGLGGIDRGFFRILENDGYGYFKDVTEQLNLFQNGAWKASAFADFDCNGTLDFFASNVGDFRFPYVGISYQIGDNSSKWFLQHSKGFFIDPGLGNLRSTPFGWGNAVFDYDNDGDADIVFYGGQDSGLTVEATNPGIILQNQDCSAIFTYASQAASDTDHTRRNVHGLAVGDLDNNGFPDIVTVSNLDIPDQTPLLFAPETKGVFDETAFMVPIWTAQPELAVFWPTEPRAAFEFDKGSLSVELNSGDNANNWLKVSLLGTVGITINGRSNRDGIGATVRFTPENGHTVMYPVMSGGSTSSQHSLVLTLGLGPARKGTLEILWPGGTLNRFYDLPANHLIQIPEIPCSVDANWESPDKYHECVNKVLRELENVAVIDSDVRYQLEHSTMRAFMDDLD